MLIDAAGDVIGAPAVMAALESELDPPDVQRLYLERKSDRFALRVVGRDQQRVERLAQRWSELAISALDQAARHVIAADILERYISSLTVCVEQIPSSWNGGDFCGLPSLSEVQRTIREAGMQLHQEMAASQGLIPGIRYWLSKEAQLSEKPVQYNRKYLLLGGGLIGFALGTWLLHLRLPERIRRR
jgi:hypothetical protein